MKFGIMISAVHSRWPGSMLCSLPSVRELAVGARREARAARLPYGGARGLEPRVEDPAEGALAGPEADHRGVEPDRRLVLGDPPIVRERRRPPLNGPIGTPPSRSRAEAELPRPKASATFCWAITGSIA